MITEAWVRVRPRPSRRASAAVVFDDFISGVAAVRALSQSALHPSNCRLLDPLEAAITGAGDGSGALLVLGFEAAEGDVEPWMSAALQCCADHGGKTEGGRSGVTNGGRGGSGSRDAVASWRQAFVRAPYLLDVMVAMGVLSETFESAITWDRFDEFVVHVTDATRRAGPPLRITDYELCQLSPHLDRRAPEDLPVLLIENGHPPALDTLPVLATQVHH